MTWIAFDSLLFRSWEAISSDGPASWTHRRSISYRLGESSVTWVAFACGLRPSHFDLNSDSLSSLWIWIQLQPCSFQITCSFCIFQNYSTASIISCTSVSSDPFHNRPSRGRGTLSDHHRRKDSHKKYWWLFPSTSSCFSSQSLYSHHFTPFFLSKFQSIYAF